MLCRFHTVCDITQRVSNRYTVKCQVCAFNMEKFLSPCILRLNEILFILRLIPPRTLCLRPPIVSTGSESPCSRRSCIRLSPTSSKTVKSGPKQQKSQRAKNNTIHWFYFRFYDAGKSVVGDPDLGQILASLIGVVGYMSEMNKSASLKNSIK